MKKKDIINIILKKKKCKNVRIFQNIDDKLIKIKLRDIKDIINISDNVKLVCGLSGTVNELNELFCPFMQTYKDNVNGYYLCGYYPTLKETKNNPEFYEQIISYLKEKHLSNQR